MRTCVRACVRVCVCVWTRASRMTAFIIRGGKLRMCCVRMCMHVCAAGRSVGRSAFADRRRRRRAFPFRITKVQRAIPQCAYFYIHSHETCKVRIIRPSGRKKRSRNAYWRTTLPCPLQVRLPSSFVLALFWGNSFTDANRDAFAKIRTAAFKKPAWRICAIFLTLDEKLQLWIYSYEFFQSPNNNEYINKMTIFI